MKRVTRLLMIIFSSLFIIACSDDFLNENLSISVLPTGGSNLIISPKWDEDTYEFRCPIAKNTTFTIVETPEWLEIENKTGSLTVEESAYSPAQSMGVVRARVKKNDAFDKTGIYMEFMKVKADGALYQIPVYYITEGTPKVSVNGTLAFNYGSPYLQINNTGDGILLWEIVSMPDWINVNLQNVNIQALMIPRYSQSTIPLEINAGAAVTSNSLTGNIVLRTNDVTNETVTIKVSADLGTPVLYLSGIYSGKMDFTIPTQTYTVDLNNHGNGWLVWEFTDLPEWLVVNKTKGTLSSYYSEDIVFSCNADKLQPGNNSAVIQLKTNDAARRSVSIEVNARGAGNNASTYAIEGVVVDATVVRSRNLMVYATSQPNKLIFYNLETKKVENEVVLSKSPNCFAIAEDYSSAAVGHGGMVSAVNLTDYKVSKTIDVNNTVYDIVWADSSVYWYAEQTNYSDYLYVVDFASGAKSTITENDIDGKTRIKKVPNQPFVVASRQSTSPSGFITMNITQKKLQSYAHKDLGDFWFSEDGAFTYARGGDIYRTNTATASTETFSAVINSIARFRDTNGKYYYPLWVDHLESKNKLFIIHNDYDSNLICEFDDNDYMFRKSYTFDKMYQPTTGASVFEVQARYVFANSTGTELAVLRKAKVEDNSNWSLEFLKLD